MYERNNIPSTLQTQNMKTKKQKFEDSNLSNNIIINDFWQIIPSGFKFLPTEQELIMAYLRKKVMNEPLEPNLIAEAEIYKYNPEQLSRQYRSYGENEWYFFSPRDRKYKNGNRPKRSTEDGYWKASGKCQPIYSNDDEDEESTLIGKWRTLVYYEGNHHKSKKTNWIMREYYLDETTHTRISPSDVKLDDWVLCKIYKNNKNYMKSSAKEEAYIEPIRIEPIQMIYSSKILPQLQHEPESNNMDPVQLNPHSSSGIFHNASSNPPYFNEIKTEMSSLDDVWNSIDLDNYLDMGNNI